jgi:hypothetical protein
MIRELPAPGQINRYLFTCAQNATKLHETFWKSLNTLMRHYQAQLHVSRITYMKHGLGAAGDKAKYTKPEPGNTELGDDIWWDAQLDPYLSDERLQIAPGLVWCGEMNILPTAERPLSGLDSYTGRPSGIFPHPKLAMESIATLPGEGTKFNYTTGAVTQRNYVQRKAGLKADFHHCYGALLVEVDSEGSWWCRQINADSEGVIHDLRLRVDGDQVTEVDVAAIVWGDIHVAEGDPAVYQTAWAPDGMLDTLHPAIQFWHDILHFRGRSHHEIKDPHRMFLRSIQHVTSVEDELKQMVAFTQRASRPWCQAKIVDSNHHHHLARWLREVEGLKDPTNAILWCELNAEVLKHIRRYKEEPNCLQVALRHYDLPAEVLILPIDKSFTLLGIEFSLHGDRGPNGARGSARNLSKLGVRAIIGHSHSARIEDGVYQTGTCGTLTPDWTSGPNSWSHSHVIVYPNGKRAVITMWKGKWRA